MITYLGELAELLAPVVVRVVSGPAGAVLKAVPRAGAAAQHQCRVIGVAGGELASFIVWTLAGAQGCQAEILKAAHRGVAICVPVSERLGGDMSAVPVEYI